MKASKYLFFNLALLFFCPKLVHASGIFTDTTYFISTQQLKSNQIPDSVFSMVHLKHLSVQGMDCDYVPSANCWAVAEIPAKIKGLRNLRTLRLIVNAITTLPVELSELKELRVLDLTDNVTLDNIDVLPELLNLEELDLYGCNLSKLPQNIGLLKKLRFLGLTGNNVSAAEKSRIKNALPNCIIRF